MISIGWQISPSTNTHIPPATSKLIPGPPFMRMWIFGYNMSTTESPMLRLQLNAISLGKRAPLTHQALQNLIQWDAKGKLWMAETIYPSMMWRSSNWLSYHCPALIYLWVQGKYNHPMPSSITCPLETHYEYPVQRVLSSGLLEIYQMMLLGRSTRITSSILASYPSAESHQMESGLLLHSPESPVVTSNIRVLGIKPLSVQQRIFADRHPTTAMSKL